MAIKEILQMRLISSFGSFRKSKSNLLLLLLYSISGLGILPLILNEGGLSEQFPIGTIMQFPILYLFPVLFLSYSLISKISVVDYEYDFVLSNQVTPKDFLLAKTLFDLSMTIFILFLPFMISFFVLIVLMKVVYVLLFCLIFLVLILSIVLENSFKVLIMFHNKKLVKVLVILLIVVMCIPVPFRII